MLSSAVAFTLQSFDNTWSTEKCALGMLTFASTTCVCAFENFTFSVLVLSVHLFRSTVACSRLTVKAVLVLIASKLAG